MKAALLATLLCATACAPPVTPKFDEDLGVAAQPVEPGALAGTFGLKTVSSTLAHASILGDFQGGGANFRLVTRTYDDATSTYQQRSSLCGGFNFEVAGVTTSIPE